MGAEDNRFVSKEHRFPVTKRQIGLAMIALTTAGVTGGAVLRHYMNRENPVEVTDPIYDIVANVARVASQDNGNRMAHFYFPAIVRSIKDSSKGNIDVLAQQTSRFIHQTKETRIALARNVDLQAELTIDDPQYATAQLAHMERFVRQGVRNSLAREIHREGIHIERMNDESQHWGDVFSLMNQQWDKQWPLPDIKRLRHGLRTDYNPGDEPESKYQWLAAVRGRTCIGYATYTKAPILKGDLTHFPFPETAIDADDEGMILVTSVTVNPEEPTPAAQLALFLGLREVGVANGMDVMAPALSPFALSAVKKGRVRSYAEGWLKRDKYDSPEDIWRLRLALCADDDNLGVNPSFMSFPVSAEDSDVYTSRGIALSEYDDSLFAHVPAGFVGLLDYQNYCQFPDPEDCRLLENV